MVSSMVLLPKRSKMAPMASEYIEMTRILTKLKDMPTPKTMVSTSRVVVIKVTLNLAEDMVKAFLHSNLVFIREPSRMPSNVATDYLSRIMAMFSKVFSKTTV